MTDLAISGTRVVAPSKTHREAAAVDHPIARQSGIIEVLMLSNLPEWVDRGACRGADPNLFFPERGASTREAKAICHGCGVEAECLEWGLGEKFGIWGGIAERDRREIRRQRVLG